MDNTEKNDLIDKYRKAANKLVLLDYDGTLVNYELIPDDAKLPDHLVDILLRLTEQPKTKVFIISGRGYKDVDKLLGHLPLKIIAEHGAMIKEEGQWKNQVAQNCFWKKEIIPVLNQFTAECPNSFIEEKSFSLTWHYRKVETELGYLRSRELIRLMEKTILPYDLKILDGNKVVEILTNDTGKGKAVKKLFGQNSYDFVLSIGDDATDEEMFEFLLNNSRAFTIKVGNGPTYARHKLKNISDVASLLNKLSE